MKNSPFTIIRGGQAEPVTVPKQFAQFHNKEAEIERYKADFIARRTKFILKERAKQASQIHNGQRSKNVSNLRG